MAEKETAVGVVAIVSGEPGLPWVSLFEVTEGNSYRRPRNPDVGC